VSTNPTAPFTNESSKDDRLEALKNDRSQHQPRPTGGQTYLSRAIADAGSELGRWRHLSEQHIVGARGPQPTTYHAMQREPEQQLVLDQSADGHSALALQAERGRIPVYPAQPNNVWNVDAGQEPPLGIDISAVKDVSKV
jgi:hypothetical protein